jgi:hypothetical protein
LRIAAELQVLLLFLLLFLLLAGNWGMALVRWCSWQHSWQSAAAVMPAAQAFTAQGGFAGRAALLCGCASNQQQPCTCPGFGLLALCLRSCSSGW